MNPRAETPVENPFRGGDLPAASPLPGFRVLGPKPPASPGPPPPPPPNHRLRAAAGVFTRPCPLRLDTATSTVRPFRVVRGRATLGGATSYDRNGPARIHYTLRYLLNNTIQHLCDINKALVPSLGYFFGDGQPL